MRDRDTLDLTSMLFVPAANPRMIAKARELDAPAVILDLEDGVGVGQKVSARNGLAAEIGNAWPERPMLWIRVNGPQTELFRADLHAVAALPMVGVCIPKCESRDDVLNARHELASAGAHEDVLLCPFIESARGILNAADIAAASPRVGALALGSEDLAADMGIRRTKEGGELAYWRGVVATAAHASGAIPVDAVFIDFSDPEGLEADAAAGRGMGFGGKQIIHPSQIAPVARAYASTPEERDRARRIVDAYDAAEREGRGVVVVDGHMIDRPIVLQARRVLARR